jgi:hypothetical protein
VASDRSPRFDQIARIPGLGGFRDAHGVLLWRRSKPRRISQRRCDRWDIPVMDDFVGTPGLQRMIDETDPEMRGPKNFACIYSRIVAEPKHASIAKAIEQHVHEPKNGAVQLARGAPIAKDAAYLLDALSRNCSQTHLAASSAWKTASR